MAWFSTAAFAADTPEAALGEVNIYNGEHELDYLSINGAVKKQVYTYFLYESTTVFKKNLRVLRQPDYPRRPQTVGPGESIKYLADETASDPKVVGIISNGYPHRSLGELNLDNKYQAYYATKMAAVVLSIARLEHRQPEGGPWTHRLRAGHCNASWPPPRIFTSGALPNNYSSPPA